jgi:DNA anti-recombination protein RmuC
VAPITDQQQTAETHASEQAESFSPTSADTGTASLDKVRDILFGGQMRDLDQRFARVEERLTRETANLAEDVRKRLAAVEQFAGTEAEALAQRLKAEYEARTGATNELSRQLQATSGEFEKRTGLIDDQLARAQRELRQQILEVHQQLTNEIHQKFDAVLAQLRQEALDLRAGKADRVTLAALFTEVAMKLTSEPSAKGDEEPRR